MIDDVAGFHGPLATQAFRSGAHAWIVARNLADRLEAVKWRDFKMAFYASERDWWTPAVKLGVPKMFDLVADPKEEHGETATPNGWVPQPPHAW
jgi:hypothetical protein